MLNLVDFFQNRLSKSCKEQHSVADTLGPNQSVQVLLCICMETLGTSQLFICGGGGGLDLKVYM